MKIPSFISKSTLYLLVLLVLVMPVGQALAADIMVDSDCSLQNAVLSANGEAMLAPLDACEAGDAPDEAAENTGLDTITIDVSGTAEGIISLDSTLSVTSEIAIEGAGSVLSGANARQIFSVTAGSLSVRNLTMTEGRSETHGGAISVIDASLTLANSVVSNSGAAGFGGGVYALNSNVSLTDSVITGNTIGIPEEIPVPEEDTSATDDDQTAADDEAVPLAEAVEEPSETAQTEGGEENHVHDDADDTEEPETLIVLEINGGGGLYFDGPDNSLLIEKSGIDSNSSPSNGGGLIVNSGSAAISNSTINDNISGVDGGGVYNAGSSTLTHVTVIGNTAAGGGGIYDAEQLQLYNSILSENAVEDCNGTLNANIGNLIQDQSCGHMEISDDPNLLLLGGSPAYYLPQKGSAALDAASAAYCLPTDQRGIERDPNACDIGAAEFEAGAFSFQIQSALLLTGEGGRDSEPEEEEETPEPEPAATATPSNCGSLPSHISVTNTTGSVNCSELDGGGVGNQTLVDNGFIYAVDIFGWLPSPVQACFQYNSGAIVMLDAATSPRSMSLLYSWAENGNVCAMVDIPGSVVLMPLAFLTSGHVTVPVWDLTGCTVTTTDILNLRSEASASSALIGNVLNGVALSADKRETGFYRVSYYDIIGWLSASYVTTAGRC